MNEEQHEDEESHEDEEEGRQRPSRSCIREALDPDSKEGAPSRGKGEGLHVPYICCFIYTLTPYIYF